LEARNWHHANFKGNQGKVMKLEGILLSNPREAGEGEENYQGFLIFPKIALQSGEVFCTIVVLN
jgi:hypothetical protein